MLLAILGRQPEFGLAELESLLGSQNVQPIGAYGALLKVEAIDHRRLGGTIKLAKPLIPLPMTSWQQLANYTIDQLPKHLGLLPKGKLKLGLSAYGVRTSNQQLLRTGLELKKVGRAAGRSIRVVPNTAMSLNSAQVLHNHLTGDLGMELCFIGDGRSTWLAQTISVQDVDDYSRRDYGRPKRDAFVGMLPPKLAQIMVNVACGQAKNITVLDPFCGTGVVLQEALLMGHRTYGSDAAEKMIDYTKINIDWLTSTYNLKGDHFWFEIADATAHTWRMAPFTNVVCETYLGQPLSGLPSEEKLQEIMGTCNKISSAFLKNLRPQVKKGSRHCIAVPAWQTKKGLRQLKMLDDLEKFGYNRVRFQHVRNNELVYHRDDQIVARELIVIEAA